jgi:inhibitor of cysteine peptidase
MPDMNTTTLTEADNGKSLKIGLGDAVTIRLKENPTTGYRWAVDRIDNQVLQTEASDFNAGTAGGIGSGGEHTFSFRSKKTGTAGIQFKLWREWEGDRSITDRYSVNIEVADRA